MGGRLSTELPAARFSWPVLGPTRPPSSSKHLPEQRSSRRLRLWCRLGPFSSNDVDDVRHRLGGLGRVPAAWAAASKVFAYAPREVGRQGRARAS